MRKFLGALALAATLTVFGNSAAAQGKLEIKETSLGKLGEQKDLRSYSVNTAQTQLAVLGKKGEKFVVSVNGQPDQEYEWIVAGSLGFTAEGNKHVYLVQQANKVFVVLGGKEGKQYHEVVNQDIFRSPKGDRIAYLARPTATGKRLMVVDDLEGKEFDQVGAFSFSPDGTRFAYGVETGGKQYFIVDNKPTKEFDKVLGQAFVWTADGKQFAYPAVREQKMLMVIGDKEEGPYDQVTAPVFSPDGQHLAYSAKRNDKWVVIADGKEQAEYEAIDSQSLRYSPDNLHFAYVAVKAGKKSVLVLDGKEQKELDGVAGATVRFSPDSARLAYMGLTKTKDAEGKDSAKLFWVLDGEELRAYDGLDARAFVFSPDSKRFFYVAVRNKRNVVVIDRIEGKEYDEIVQLQFSPDSKHVAYMAKRENRVYAVVDNAEGVGYVTAANLVFSPDGKRMAYVAGRDKSMFVVVDGVEGKNYAGIVAQSLAFSPDGKNLAYEARKEEGKPLFIVNSEESKEHDGSLKGSHLAWTDATLKSMVLRDNEVFRMEMTVGQ